MKSIAISLLVSILCFTTALAQKNQLLLQKVQWTLEDCKKLSTHIDTLAPDAYPVLKNKQTTATFQKIISDDYREILQDASIDLQVKFPFVLEYQRTINKIFKKYQAADKAHDYGIELMYFQGVLLDISAEMIVLVKEFVKTLDKNDESYQMRMDGVKQAKLGLKQQLDGAFMIIKGTKDTSDEERIILSKYLANSGGAILDYLDEEYRKEFLTKIQKQISIEQNVKVKSQLQTLLLKVK